MKSKRSAAIWAATLATALSPLGTGCSGSTTKTSPDGGTTANEEGGGGNDAGSSPFGDSGLTLESATCTKCMETNCTTLLTAVAADPLAVALSNCSVTNKCIGDCCFCDNNMVCSKNSCTNYAGGPCAAEVEMAAGVPSPSDCITNGKAIGTNCQDPTNSCGKATLLGQCQTAMCTSACSPPTCPPS